MHWKVITKLALFVVVTAAQLYCDRKQAKQKS